MGIDITFWVLAVIAVVAALWVVLFRNLFRAALVLVLCFFAVAGLYATLNADFLAVAQVLVYIGAIAVLIIFAVMLTRNVQQGNPFNRFWFSALPIAGLMLAAFIIVALGTNWVTITPAAEVAQVPQGEATTQAIAGAIFDKDFGFILPFEIAAALILAAVIGAIALVRER